MTDEDRLNRAAVVDAGDAAREALEFIHLQTVKPPKLRLLDFMNVLFLAARIKERQGMGPRRATASKAVTASRRFAAALEDLAALVPNEELVAAASPAPTWPDRLTASDDNFEEVGLEMSKASDAVSALRKLADLGRTIE